MDGASRVVVGRGRAIRKAARMVDGGGRVPSVFTLLRVLRAAIVLCLRLALGAGPRLHQALRFALRVLLEPAAAVMHCGRRATDRAARMVIGGGRVMDGASRVVVGRGRAIYRAARMMDGGGRMPSVCTLLRVLRTAIVLSLRLALGAGRRLH